MLTFFLICSPRVGGSPHYSHRASDFLQLFQLCGGFLSFILLIWRFPSFILLMLEVFLIYSPNVKGVIHLFPSREVSLIYSLMLKIPFIYYPHLDGGGWMMSFFCYLSPFFIEFHYTFSLSYKILQYYVYYYCCNLIRM